MNRADVQTLKNWGLFTQCLRDYFIKNRFIEVPTPYLVPSPGLEPHLDPFETSFVWGKNRQELYLPTSPEFHLKKALCMGLKNIFEIKTCFRNGELSVTHQPEFWMLEWYRANAKPKMIMNDIEKLVSGLCRKFKKKAPKIKVYKMEALWKTHLDFSLTPQSTLEDLQKCAVKAGVDFSNSDDFDDIFMRLWIEKIEPAQNDKDEAWIVWHYPPSQAALARLTKDGWADRFEFYWKGLEIANAFNELNDAVEQRKRFIKDQEKKKSLGKKIVPIDEEFMTYLEKGMPAACGIALGVDRLFMALFDIKEIAQTRLFPITSY